MNIIRSIYDWFKVAVPEPTTKNFSTQMGVHFEEVREMIEEITPVEAGAELLLAKAKQAVGELATYLKAHDNVVCIEDANRKRYLDALCDQIVTATGCARMSKHDIVGAIQEVDAKNWDKFIDGVPQFDDNMKIIKRPGWTPADLSLFV